MSLERYSMATTSKNLRWADFQERDVDWLTAAGLVNDRLASALARAHATMTPGDINTLIGEVERKFKALGSDSRQAVKDAVYYELAPACGVCAGRGAPKEVDAPTLKDEVCVECGGSGKAPHPNDSQTYAIAHRLLNDAHAICILSITRKVA